MNKSKKRNSKKLEKNLKQEKERAEKAAVMLSGGLDSRLVAKIMQEQGFDIIALHFKLPFSKDETKSIKEFCKKHNLKLKIFDYSKGKLFNQYLEMLKNPKHGRGAGVNPCIDCRLFMVKKAKEFLDKKEIKFLVTGEVLGQRPMSQHKKGLDIVAEKSGLGKRLIRPLIEQGIRGRSRQKQMKMAEKFGINYPNPAGGCLLCEKFLKDKFEFLFKRGLKQEELNLINIGRHFSVDNAWVILGRDKKENDLIEDFAKANNYESHLVFPEKGVMGPTGIILGKTNPKIKDKVKNIVNAYSKAGSIKQRKQFEKYKL
ncbi:hypothetical protein GF378_02340 [Candidatus Pacearchaeota archaeon]|nr:hypothetical protein [Candidatus Pacearchaeota archaeon]